MDLADFKLFDCFTKAFTLQILLTEVVSINMYNNLNIYTLFVYRFKLVSDIKILKLFNSPCLL